MPINTVNYIQRDYVPRVDLQTLGNTYNTLEQGHQQAIKTASDLEVTLANLDLNEKEAGWRQNKLNQIRQTVADNTLYGNSYSALDDLVKQQGDIMSDGGTIGRIKAQKAYKENLARIDAAAIPEGMKQMFREENPYHYEDGPVDPVSGRVLEGKEWTPNTRPVNTIDRYAFMTQVLKNVAAESGKGESVMFLDANGKPTPDYRQSATGEIFKQVGTKWERLPKDKIKRAINAARQMVARAEDSFRQDYRYEEWKYDKEVEKAKQTGGDDTPYVEGFTDKDGNKLSYESWLDKQFDSFANAASYNHVYTDVSYGSALQSYRAAQNAGKKGLGTGQSSIDDMIARGVLGGGNVGSITVEKSNYATAVDAKTAANRQGLNIVRKYFGNSAFKGADSLTDIIINSKLSNGAYGPNIAVNNILKRLGNRITKEDAIALRQAFNGYTRANAQVTKMINAAGKNKDALAFSSEINNQRYSTGNKYGKEIVDRLNHMVSNGEYIYTLGANVANSIKQYYHVDNLNQVPGLIVGNDGDGNITVTFNSQNRNLLPKFASYAKKADDANNKTNWGNWFKKKFGYLTEDSYTISVSGGASNIGNTRGGMVRTFGDASVDLAKAYDKGVEAASKAELKGGISKGEIQMFSTDAGSIGEIFYRDKGAELGLTPSQINTEIDNANDRVKTQLAQGNFSSGQMYIVDSAGRFQKDVSKMQDYTELIQYMANNKRNNLNVTYMTAQGNLGSMPNNGYYLTFDVPDNTDNEVAKKYKGKHMKIYIGGTMNEGYNYEPSLNATHIADNNFQVAKSTRTDIENLGYNNNLGDTRIINRGAGKYSIGFLGHNKIVTENQAISYNRNMELLRQMKEDLWSGAYDNATLLDNSIDALAVEIARNTGNNLEQTNNAIRRYLSNPM